jgi:hypothetical protein
MAILVGSLIVLEILLFATISIAPMLATDADVRITIVDVRRGELAETPAPLRKI